MDDFPFDIDPPERWETSMNGVSFATKADVFTYFYNDRADPANLNELKYVIQCCLDLEDDPQLLKVQQLCGFINGTLL